MASGLGIYVELNNRIVREDTRELVSWGFIAPFANFRMVLIDPRAMTIESDLATAVGVVKLAGLQGDPWKAISDRQQVQYLESLLTSEISRMTPILLRERKR